MRWREAENIPPTTLAHQLTVRDDKPTWAKSAIPSGPAMCTVSVQMKFLLEAGEVESKTTSRTMTYLVGNPEENNSMSRKRRTREGLYATALQVLCAWLDWDFQT
ncbi:MAG: hypothetical protein ACXVDN_09450 [Ktedonobacteraceae bacterium]